MPSLIQGYEYDIFISYRHKDNKGGHWVTEFVNALKGELESTFKEDISVYFDENPHDGLHEMHDVDGSLKEKIKCLIFIPILSRTYCDPQSFAWQHEFLPFLDFASGDSFGLKVKLPNGNVVSRILPVRIYDLSTEDTVLFEAETKGPIRAIDFVFKSAGVNRPLLPADRKEENLTHTAYRDQVNKTANVIEDIIASLQKPAQSPINQDYKKQERELPAPTSSGKKIWASIMVVLVIVFGAWMAYKSIGGDQNKTEEVIDKSIAVLPFDDISETHDQGYFSDGMMVEILDHLFKIKDLRIIPRNSTLGYKDSSKPLKAIASELGVAHLIQGSVRKFGNRVKISVQLIGGGDEQLLWQQTYDRELTDLFAIQSDVATQIANVLQAQISPDVQKRIQAIPTQNQEAYDMYLKGQQIAHMVSISQNTNYVKEGIEYFNKAISLDSTFSDAYTALGNSYWNLAHWAPDYTPDYWRKSKVFSNKAIALDPQNAQAYSELAVVQHNWDWDEKAAIRSLQKAVKLKPADPAIYTDLFWFYCLTSNCDSMKVVLNKIKELQPGKYYSFETVVNICGHDENNLQAMIPPKTIGNWITLWAHTERLIILGEYERALQKMDSSKNLISEDFRIYLKAEAFGLAGNKKEAIKAIKDLEQLNKIRHIWPSQFAIAYMALGDENKAYEYLEKGIEERDRNLHGIQYSAAFYKKKNDPRFQAFVRRTWIN